ncbi:hypothetical protein AVEN_56052-1 [Araneus ventricosus]|uniref:Uncharacterized protein n=1 Tax=Araneus ventricosus TaxID=182803 RepID=A0A4Y2DLR2_ARAVE|nr:hypothetical protein AVEN_56052-1 [Araneus ventricosus]
MNFLPGDEIIGDTFQQLLFEVWCWFPHKPRHSKGAFRGIVKCRSCTTKTVLIAVREVEFFEVGRERAIFREEDNILSNPVKEVKERLVS